MNQQDKVGVEMNSSGYFCNNLVFLISFRETGMRSKKVNPRLTESKLHTTPEKPKCVKF